ncbi:MAG: C45 family autoproteolytic acyltransferase/hydrolase [Candidatus Cryptobacteroides sp.]|nr:C45 family autoproteolytic acyltransferase/hydrolase [Bacteroidales bacterium]
MNTLLKIFKWLAGSIVSLVGVIAIFCLVMHSTVDLKEPSFTPAPGKAVVMDSLRILNDNYFRINPSGLLEIRVAGNASERGEAMGKLIPDLLEAQEKAFVDKLYEIVPAEAYRRFLMYFIYIFNRRLGENVADEFREEIRAMSEYCTHKYDAYGTPYERQMQYHSAHDIGHVMQDYMLVGCTSFAVWGDESADGELLVGRNFDFYMGDEFAGRNMVLVERPDSGYAFISVTWPGMTGVLSGMNECGLTVSINASKLETPKMSATPVSILSREILQYASNIEEAMTIASFRKTFVSESLLISSVEDGKAVVIEKTPSEISLFDPSAKDSSIHRLICTNHYQSELFSERRENLANLEMSDSGERWRRVEELLDSAGRLNPESAAAVLRDKKGLGGKSLGYCNELAVNQLLAMHSVIFKPSERQLWVSAGPWQCGEYVCFDLDDYIQAGIPVLSSENSIPADEFLMTEDYVKVMEFRKLSQYIHRATADRRKVPIDSLNRFISLNPLYFNAYNIAGDYFSAIGDDNSACELWKKSLSFEMKRQEKLAIEEKLSRAER